MTNTTNTTDSAPKGVRSNGWKPGQSGNPAGRAPGSSQLQKLRDGIAKDVPEILRVLVDAAKGGDMHAARLILERVLPPVKSIELPVTLPAPANDTLTGQGRAVLAAVSDGDLAPGQAAQLMTAISSLARVMEVDELAARVTALENKDNKGAPA
jgi:hypothetical protein